MKLCTYCNAVAIMLVVFLLAAESTKISERALQRKRSWDGAQTADVR